MFCDDFFKTLHDIYSQITGWSKFSRFSAQLYDIRVLRRIRDFENHRFRRNDKVWNYGTVELHVSLGVLYKKKVKRDSYW